jgi:hypothetical protein
VKKSSFASKPRHAWDKDARGGARGHHGVARATGAWPSSWRTCMRPTTGCRLSGA